jgi:hypothetical protein
VFIIRHRSKHRTAPETEEHKQEDAEEAKQDEATNIELEVTL